MNSLPDKLLNLRKYYGLSQSYLAEYLDIEVIDYMGFENGRSVPSFEELKKLAKLYRISNDDLFDNRKEIEFIKDIKPSNDTSNFHYLTKQTKKEKKSEYWSKNKKPIMMIAALALGIVVCVIICVFLLFPSKNEINKMTKSNKNRLDASNVTVVYLLGNGEAMGRGDNSYGQLDFDSKDVFKVQEGANFTVVLKNDGTLVSAGLVDNLANEINEWRDIVDVEVGRGHILALDKYGKVYCAGDDTYDQCRFEKDSGITQIFASNNASFLVDAEGKLYHSGEVIHEEILAEVDGFIDIEAGNNIITYINTDGTVNYYSLNDFSEVLNWKDIVDIEIGLNYIAGLDASGKVYVATEDEELKNAEGTFENMLAIAGADSYFVAYDGSKIYGVGDNAYGQYEITDVNKTPLAKVENVSVEMNDADMTIVIKFDASNHANGYRLTYDDKTLDSSTNSFTIPYSEMEDGKKYDFTIIALGNDKYEDSSPVTLAFTYNTPKVTIMTGLVGMSRDEFKSYLGEIGVNIANVTDSKDPMPCEFSGTAKVTSVNGLEEGKEYNREELKNLRITYTYCEPLFEEGGSEDLAD